MIYKWKYDLPTAEEEELGKELAKDLKISPVLGSILCHRGIKDPDEARQFFHPQLSHLHDPFLMNDMEKAVHRLNKALGRKERIMVYGDYDVDGCTAVTLVYKFLLRFYSNIEYYIPNREEEGYGISFEGIDYAKSQNVKLIIVLDCGIKAIKEIAYAKEQGIDFIVCDHHMPDEEMPPAYAILDAKRADNTYPYRHLSGCGVGFKLMQAFAMNNGIPFAQLIPLMDLCAVSIAADIVPVTGENRILAYYGLKRLNTNPCVGLKAIINVCGLEGRELTMNDIVFKIGPRINASCRVREGRKSVDLLVEKNYNEAIRKANRVNEYNEIRKNVDKEMTKEANTIVESLRDLKERHSIVLYNENWMMGVVGIVASRLTEIYNLPTIILTRSGNMAIGSARSISDFNIYKAIESNKDLLLNFGGHTHAVGLSLKIENIPLFRKRLEEYVASHILPRQTEPSLTIESEIDFKTISKKLCHELKRLSPFGPGNPKPLFCTHKVYDYGTSKVVGREQEHIKLELVDNHSNIIMNGIAFGQSSQARYIKTKRSFDICYTIEENTHKRGDIQLQIEDIKPTEEHSNDS